MEEMRRHLNAHYLSPGVQPPRKSPEVQSLNGPEEEEAKDAGWCAGGSPQTRARMLSQGKPVFLSKSRASHEHPQPNLGERGCFLIQTGAAASWPRYVGLKVARRVGAGKGTWQGRLPRGHQVSPGTKGLLQGRPAKQVPWGLLPGGKDRGSPRPPGLGTSRGVGKRARCADIAPGFRSRASNPPILPRSPRPSPAGEQPAGDNRRAGSRAPAGSGGPPPPLRTPRSVCV